MAKNKKNTDPLQVYASFLQPLGSDSKEVKQAKNLAKTQYKSQINALNTRQKQLQDLRNQDVSLLQQNQKLAQRNINDDTFQQYLQTQENLNKRGLLNSGLRQDANIRLNMNKNRVLEDLYSKTQGEMNQINQIYSPQISDIAAQRQGLSLGSFENKIISDLNDQRLQQAQAYSKILPYTSLTAYQKENLNLSQQKMKQSQNNADRTYALQYKKYQEQKNEAEQAGLFGGAEGQLDYFKDERKAFQEKANSYKSLLTSGNLTDEQKAYYEDLRKEAQQEANKYTQYINQVVRTGNIITIPEPEMKKTKKRKEVTTKGWGNRDYLQGVLDDPLYVNQLSYAVGERDITKPEVYGKGLGETSRGMTPTLAAMRLVNSGIKPTISNQTLDKYKEVSQGKGGGFFGVSPAEREAAKNFLNYYKSNKNKFIVK